VFRASGTQVSSRNTSISVVIALVWYRGAPSAAAPSVVVGDEATQPWFHGVSSSRQCFQLELVLALSGELGRVRVGVIRSAPRSRSSSMILAAGDSRTSSTFSVGEDEDLACRGRFASLSSMPALARGCSARTGRGRGCRRSAPARYSKLGIRPTRRLSPRACTRGRQMRCAKCCRLVPCPDCPT